MLIAFAGNESNYHNSNFNNTFIDLHNSWRNVLPPPDRLGYAAYCFLLSYTLHCL